MTEITDPPNVPDPTTGPDRVSAPADYDEQTTTFRIAQRAFAVSLPPIATWMKNIATLVQGWATTASNAATAAQAAANYQGLYNPETFYAVGESVTNPPSTNIFVKKTNAAAGTNAVSGADWLEIPAPLTLEDIPAILQPINASPAASATDLGSGPTLTGSQYASLYGLAQAASQWQVSTSSSFATTVVSTGDVAGVGVTYTVPSGTLSVSTTYYWRCRYKDPNGVYSDWSDGTSFTTAAFFYPSAEVAKILASDGAAGDEFGHSCGISGDLVIVGSRADTAGAANSGSAYIFKRDSGGTWTQEQKLVAGSPGSAYYFGHSVDISGDYAIVGSPDDDDVAAAAGSVYIFKRDSGGTWTQQQKLVPSDHAGGDFFGWSVAIDGTRAVIGSAYKASSTGAAYVFDLSGGTWSQTIKLTASDAATGDFFGGAVSISGDRIVVGAKDNDDSGTSSGAAYVFDLSGGTWSQTTKLTASDAASNDKFGVSVSVSGNIVFVGANNEGTGGAAYVFELDGTWSQVEKLTDPSPTSSDQFGVSVSVSGGYAVVGAWQSTATGDGFMSVFSRAGDGSWSQSIKLTASDAADGDKFGFWVAMDGTWAVASAPGEDANGSNAGAAYIFE